MTSKTHFTDQRGVSAVEFALTLPVFILLLFGLWQICFGLWAQYALQHGAEMGARCMAIKATFCGTVGGTQSYAASQSYGLNPSPTIFTVSQPACGNKIAADYTVSPIVTNIGIPAFTVHAQACYAT